MTSAYQVIGAADVAEWDDVADLLVIGYGIAGACAALEARDENADVLVVERASGGGGASALSGGRGGDGRLGLLLMDGWMDVRVWVRVSNHPSHKHFFFCY